MSQKSHDLVIRGGTVIDGTGQPRFAADVAVDDGRISAVGQVNGTGRREINAADRLVLPGWVDCHTHYDGQATWDPYMPPSANHGVTTAIFGNCGVGFAPVRPGQEKYLINLMEGVEDIPETVLAEGMDPRERYGRIAKMPICAARSGRICHRTATPAGSARRWSAPSPWAPT